MDITKTITHLSLCSGYEGIGLGLRRVLPNLREIAYVEREGFPIANLVAKMEAGELDAAPVFTDVKTFPYGKFLGCVDILSGGFPCQPFSAAGKRKATEDPRHLFPFIAEGIRECKPRIVFLENVAGIISAKTADGESVLQYVLRELEGLGYRATAGIFSAEEVGAPHQRKRVFILGLDDPRLLGQKKPEQQTAGLEQSSEELGNSQHDGCITSEDSRETSKSQEEGRVQESQRGSDELADSERSRLRGGRCSKERGDDTERLQGNEGERHELRSETKGCGDTPRTELADSNSWRGEVQNQGQLTGEQVLECDGGSWGTWPARPGQPQHEWEEPRVVADKGNGQAQPELGGAINGASSRVDRLRLLGNGVVPATAAKAFVTLLQRLV